MPVRCTCLCWWLYVCMHAFTFTHIYGHTCLHLCTFELINIMYTYTYTHTDIQVHAHVQMYIYMHAGGGACANGALAVHLAIIERVGIQQILQRDVYVHMDMCVYLYVYLAIIEWVGIQQVLLWPNVLGVHALHLYA